MTLILMYIYDLWIHLKQWNYKQFRVNTRNIYEMDAPEEEVSLTCYTNYRGPLLRSMP